MIQSPTPAGLVAAFHRRQQERREATRGLLNGGLRVQVHIGANLLAEKLTTEIAGFNETVSIHFEAEKSWASDVVAMLTTAATIPAETTAATSAGLKIRRLDLTRQNLTLLDARGKLLPSVIEGLEQQHESSRTALEKLTADTREMLEGAGFHPPGVPLNAPVAVKQRAIGAAANMQDDVRSTKAAHAALKAELDKFRQQRAAVARDREMLLAELGAAVQAIVGTI